MLDNVLLKELVDKVNDCETAISVSFNSNNISLLNVIEPDELTITDKEIVIESNHLSTNINIGDECLVIRNENVLEDEYILKGNEMELYITMV